MKTLDEVIAELEDEGLFPDALYHLKMYRSDMQMYAENQKYWEDELKQKIKDFGDAKERYIAKLKELDIGTLNDPLTWDELRTMEGKPVWVEDSNHQGEWVLLSGTEDDILYFVYRTCNEYKIYRKEQGTLWQAYRKERATGGYLRPEPQSVKIGSDVEVKWHEADNREGLK